MNDSMPVREYQESRIENEPILGRVLTLPDGSVQPLTWLEKMLVSLHLTNAKALAARHLKSAHG